MISEKEFYELTDYVENAVLNGCAPKRDSVFGILTRFFNAYGIYILGIDRIFIDPVGTLEEEAWVYLHEVAHWAMQRKGIKNEHAFDEQVCDDVAFIVMERQGKNLYRLV
jgi:hypothetical protein